MSDLLDKLGWNEEQLGELRQLAADFRKQGKYDLAITLLKGVTAIADRDPTDHQTLGALYLQVGNLEFAMKTLQRALLLDRTHLPTHLNRAKALFVSGKHAQGMNLARKLTRVRDSQVAQEAEALLMAYTQQEPCTPQSPPSPSDQDTGEE